MQSFSGGKKINWRNVEASIAKMLLTCFLNATVSEVSLQTGCQPLQRVSGLFFGVFSYQLSAPFSSVTSGGRVSG